MSGSVIVAGARTPIGRLLGGLKDKSAADLGAHHLRWLQAAVPGAPLEEAAAALDQVSLSAKSLILKGARAVSTGKRTDFAPLLSTMVTAWGTAMAALSSGFGV